MNAALATKRAPALFTIEIEINGTPRWCLKSGLCTTQRADAHKWTQTDAHAYAAQHLDPTTVRHIRRAK